MLRKSKKEKILVTGAAGFIGMHVCKRLLDDSHFVIGLDNLNDYYDVKLKKDRLLQLKPYKNFKFIKQDVANQKAMAKTFSEGKFDKVIHLAAQAGVRYSITNPYPYVDSNLVGFLNILEGCRHNKIKHLVFASSSSVYGANNKTPYKESDKADHPVSLYAATKKANELMAHAYSHLYSLPATGLRFFTVYGPWGRPDMATKIFADAITKGESIPVFNNGNLNRDFTYIDDIVEGVVRVLNKLPKNESSACFQIYNIGNNKPVKLLDFIKTMERAIGQKAVKKMMPHQPGDVLATHADINAIKNAVGFAPKTRLEDGIAKFVSWHKSYYGNK